MDKYNFEDVREKYSIMYFGTMFLNILYSIIFYLAECKEMFLVSVVSSVFYIVLSILALKVKNIKVCFNSCFFHIILFSVAGTLHVGYSSGFSLYLLCIIPLSSYLLYMLKDRARKVIHVVEILVGCYFTSTLLSMMNIIKPGEMEILYHKLLFVINSFVGIILLTGFLAIYLIRLNARRRELEFIANYDPLTKLLNRRTFDKFFIQKYEEFIKDKKVFSAILFDIDDFKKVNDTYGHDIGDEVLENVTAIIRETVPVSDQVFRWGGEEILILVSMDKSKAKKMAEDCRANVNELKFSTDEVNFKVTVTGGVHTFTNKDSKDTLIVKADKALYEGKNNGKNQIVVYK